MMHFRIQCTCIIIYQHKHYDHSIATRVVVAIRLVKHYSGLFAIFSSYSDGGSGTNPCLTFFPGQSSPGDSGNTGNNTPPPNRTQPPVDPGNGAVGGDNGNDVGAKATPGKL